MFENRMLSMGLSPRVRGNPLTAPGLLCCPGLSPRVRGNPLNVSLALSLWWSIPACAGKPLWRQKNGQSRRVYPRVCGETWNTIWSGIRNGGLSPRVRGNHLRGQHLFSLIGSIPACAGKPLQSTPNG